MVPTRWPVDSHISIREMIPVVVVAALWGASWSRKSVRFWSDSTAAVALINSGSSRDSYNGKIQLCSFSITHKWGSKCPSRCAIEGQSHLFYHPLPPGAAHSDGNPPRAGATTNNDSTGLYVSALDFTVDQCFRSALPLNAPFFLLNNAALDSALLSLSHHCPYLNTNCASLHPTWRGTMSPINRSKAIYPQSATCKLPKASPTQACPS